MQQTAHGAGVNSLLHCLHCLGSNFEAISRPSRVLPEFCIDFCMFLDVSNETLCCISVVGKTASSEAGRGDKGTFSISASVLSVDFPSSRLCF